jgi:hypothetical protein
VPISGRTRALLERALLAACHALDQFGLKGSIGDCDLIMQVDGDVPSQRPSQWLRRVDIPEMEMVIRPGVAVLRLPIGWSRSGGDPEKKMAFVQMIEGMAAACNVSRILVAPYPSSSEINRAYDSVLKGATFADAARLLHGNELVVGIGPKASE